MKNTNIVPALERGIDIVELLENNPKGLSFSEIQVKLKIPKPSLVRLLQTLLKRKYVKQYDRVYKLSLRFLSLGTSVQASLGLREIARPFMEELQKKTRETVELAVPDDEDILLIDKLESLESIRIFSKIGQKFADMHSFANGKVALAFFPEEVSGRWFNNGSLRKTTEKTNTNGLKLKKEIELIRTEKVGIDIEERRPGVFRIASPVFGHGGTFLGILAIAGPVIRLGSKEELKNTVKYYAAKISKELGCEKY